MTEKELFEKALDWYQSFDPIKKKCALDLFPKEKLESKLQEHIENKKKKKQEQREEDLKKALEKCKRLFPIGTLIWSDECTDNLPHIVIDEPYIDKTEYGAPYYVYDWDEKDRKTVYAHTLRLHWNGEIFVPISTKRDLVSLERCLYDMEKTEEYRTNHIIDLKQFYKSETEKKKNNLERVKSNLEYYQRNVNQMNEEKDYYESYDPTKLTKERIQEIIKEWKG